MLVFYYHLVPELMPILWRAKLSCAIELGSTREKHIHKQQKKKREESGFRLLMASLLHVYVCMFVCEPVSIVFFFFFLAFVYRESAWAQISSLLQLVYLPMQQITDATVFLAASFFFFCVGAHAVFAKVLRQEVVHCVCMYVFLCSFLSREHLIWLLVLFSSVFLLIFPPLLFFFFLISTRMHI